MLITLITIAVASLVATPLVAPAVRRFASRNPSTNKDNDYTKDSDEKGEWVDDQLNDHLMSIDESPLQTLTALPKVAVPAVCAPAAEWLERKSEMLAPHVVHFCAHFPRKRTLLYLSGSAAHLRRFL